MVIRTYCHILYDGVHTEHLYLLPCYNTYCTCECLYILIICMRSMEMYTAVCIYTCVKAYACTCIYTAIYCKYIRIDECILYI